VSDIYHAGHRSLQDRFDTRRLADRLDEVRVHHAFSGDDAAFIAARDMFFLATADADGQPNCSYKGGDPGFVRVIDERTLVFPCYDGNGMFLSMGNVLVNAKVGLLFVDFERQRRMRVNGEASLSDEPALVALFPGAQFVVRVQATQIFPNCPRYIHHYQLVERSRFVPHAGEEAPIPAWKQTDWASDVLPAHDPARGRGLDTK
jgi:predicted pyridoxine 5'-phosphate oxidase superfamily flavin-nucleotide-binding protein